MTEGQCVLIVDDDERYRNIFEEISLNMGLQPVSAVDGVEALEKLDSRPFSLAIVDLIMPDMDGIATLEEIADIDDTVPVLLVSGYTRESDKMEDLKKTRPNVRFLAKPFQPDQLVAAAKKLLDSQAASDVPSDRASSG